MQTWISVLQACVPILVALVGIIPSIITNRKKTQESIELMQTKVTAEITATKKEIADVQNSLNQHIAEGEEEQAKQARYRILRFYDELCEDRRHSESHFEDILADIDFYECYCVAHPEFHNSRGKAAMEYIQETYKKVKATGGFLTHKMKGENIT